MKQSLWTSVSFGVALALSAVAANAFTLTGTVKDEGGTPVQNASVSLLSKGLDTKTNAKGVFTIQQEEATPGDSGVVVGPGDNPGPGSDAIHASGAVGSLSVNNGVLSFSQSSNSPVQVQIFDMVGNRLLNETLYGSGTVDMKSSVKAKGVYFARVRVGSAQ